MGIRKSKPNVKELKNNEDIVYHWKFKNKTGFLKSDKLLFLVTNKRALIADQKTKRIYRFFGISSLGVVVKNVRTDFRLGKKSKTMGTIEFWVKGKKIFQLLSENDPEGIRDTIHELQRGLGYDTENTEDYEEERMASDSIQNDPVRPEETKRSSEEPLKILKLRFARGEITKEEYEETKLMLEESD
ncbi:MAG: SHOCT domain-containing protein [Nitrosopumilus sp.]|nr:SHOCT domain-containing protein [Nitrosopumilus sp.]